MTAIDLPNRILNTPLQQTRSNRRPRTRPMIPWLLACIPLLIADLVYAGDTLELFDPGFSDFEFYLAYGGVGKEGPERGVGAETLIGIGITDRLSGYVQASGEANEKLSEGMGAFGFGIFSTPLDTDLFDFDIGLDVAIANLGAGSAGPAEHSQAELSFTPFIELNMDSDPDMNGYGAYVFVEHTLGGRDESLIDPLGEEIRDVTLTHETHLTLGVYDTVLEGHQAFLSYDMAFNHTREEGGRSTEIGGAALGYNFLATDNLEIITEVNFDIPQDDEDFGVDFLVGFISTLPSLGN